MRIIFYIFLSIFSANTGAAPENPSFQKTIDVTDVILITGQSNALGARTQSDSVLDAAQKDIFAFTAEGWQQADLSQDWDKGWPGWNSTIASAPSNNFGLHFGKTFITNNPGKSVGIILITAPGMPIKTWDKGSNFYQQVSNKVKNALRLLANKKQIDGILWHQGEADWGDSDYYEQKLLSLIRNLRNEDWFSNQRPFICAETAKSPVNRRLLALNQDADPWTGCAKAADLPTRDQEVHFSSAGLRILGKRYAQIYQSMTSKRRSIKPEEKNVE